MTNQNSDSNNSIRPEALQSELSIGRDTYYSDLKHLKIKADKDTEGKAYLTFEQAEQVRALRSYVSETGSRKGFVYEKVEHETNIVSSIIKAEEQTIETSDSSATNTIVHSEEDIYISETSPTDNINPDNLIRTAQELAARNIAIPSLIAVELSNSIRFDDLPADLQEKVRIAQDAANPKKHQPKLIAQTLLKQLRMQKIC
ncbi:hypothetical protein Xen7305DRAFT_00031690 [Xenococcus sp. PCC 7305]|uniref:hypothetical protein n=1 Tax=Xenococcus sp. PCC 7305 TaxID=102125 RepID=UPI0002ACE21D|nr:hypothetical protein [Xenococcus sp. PCC 7305]ELS03445.1 hypothetical protein Xen7305DRAFT_00031690 [Xenococcus sp. PCC 7305]